MFEREYLPGGPVEDKVFILHGDNVEELVVPDDDEDYDEEDESPHVDYD